MVQRSVTALIGLFFLIQGIQWLVVPAKAAEALGMPLLEGMGRSTQVGDLSGFFLCLGGMVVFGAIRMAPTWIRAGACLVGIVGFTRTIAWLFHDAEFASAFIAIELVAGALLFALAAAIEKVPSSH